MKSQKCVASIDLGTNSCRLVIADLRGNYLYKQIDTVRFGDGMHADNRLTEASMNRAVEVFKEYARELEKYEIVGMRAVATAAARVAKNAKEFFDKAAAETGIRFEIINPLEEAELTLKGAVSHILGKSRYVVLFDIGGGSTEIMLAENNAALKIIAAVSIPWGGTNASAVFGINDYEETAASKLRKEVEGYIDEFLAKSGYASLNGEDIIWVAISGTGLRMAAMAEDSGTYDRERMDGCVLKAEAFERQLQKIFHSTAAERDASPYIGKRADTFVAQCIFFQQISRALKVKEAVVSLRGVKDGIIEELLEKWAN